MAASPQWIHFISTTISHHNLKISAIVVVLLPCYGSDGWASTLAITIIAIAARIVNHIAWLAPRRLTYLNNPTDCFLSCEVDISRPSLIWGSFAVESLLEWKVHKITLDSLSSLAALISQPQHSRITCDDILSSLTLHLKSLKRDVLWLWLFLVRTVPQQINMRFTSKLSQSHEE